MANIPNQQTGDFYPSDLMRRVIRWWWIIVILIFLGGILGYLAAEIQKPLYESKSSITTAINFAYAGKLDDYEEDHLITAIGDVIGSSWVMEKVVDQVIENGMGLDEKTVLAGLIKSRQGYRWVLSSRFNDPQIAQQINQIWLNAAIDALEDLRANGLEGLNRLAAQYAVESCFSQSVVLEPDSAYCSGENFKQLHADVESVTVSGGGSLLTSLLISRVSFETTETPNLPDAPVLFRVNLMMLAGCMVGFIAAILLFLSGYPKIHPYEK